MGVSYTTKNFLVIVSLPFGINERFFGREAALQAFQKALDPRPGKSMPQSLALHGMGGVGKT